MSYEVPTARAGMLRLHYNENTAGCSPAVLRALQGLTREEAAFYPDYAPITRRTERWFGVEPGSVLLTNGLDEGLQLAALRARLEAAAGTRTSVVIVEPAFEMYEACAEAVGAEIVRVTPEPDFAFPLDRVLEAIDETTRLVYLTDPNNPTGVPMPAGAAERVAEAAPGSLVFVDEAYAEFSDRSVIGPALARLRNLVVGRTFAKAHGLAAVRAGAVIAHPETIDRLRRLAPPFSLNICAIRALDAAFDDRAYLDDYVRQAAASREMIYTFATTHGFEFWPSHANFVLVRVGVEAGRLVAGLDARGIAIRDKSAAPGCAGCVRITAGIVEHTKAALSAMEEILAARTR